MKYRLVVSPGSVARLFGGREGSPTFERGKLELSGHSEVVLFPDQHLAADAGGGIAFEALGQDVAAVTELVHQVDRGT